MEELNKILHDEANKDMPENQLQWKAWIVPEFEGDKSLVLMNTHHVIADGFGLVVMLADLDNDY